MKKIISFLLLTVMLFSVTVFSVGCGLTNWLDKYLEEELTSESFEESVKESEKPMPEYEGVELYLPFAKIERNYIYASGGSAGVQTAKYYEIKHTVTIDSNFANERIKNHVDFAILVGCRSAFEQIIEEKNSVNFLEYGEEYGLEIVGRVDYDYLWEFENNITYFDGKELTTSGLATFTIFERYAEYNEDDTEKFFVLMTSVDGVIYYSNFNDKGDFRDVDFDKYSYSLKGEAERILIEGKSDRNCSEYQYDYFMELLNGDNFNEKNPNLETYKSIGVGDSLNGAILYATESLQTLSDLLSQDLETPLFKITATDGVNYVDVYVSKWNYVAHFRTSSHKTLLKVEGRCSFSYATRINFEKLSYNEFGGDWTVTEVKYDKTYFSSMPIYVLK